MTEGSDRFRFRPLERSDFVLVSRWFAEPHVARWWNEPGSLDHVESKYGPRVDGGDRTSMWIIEVDGRACGLAQHYRHEDYPDHDRAVGVPAAVGIDYLLAGSHAGRGLGPGVLAALARFVLELAPDARSCVATPAQENRPSWVALERAGFRRHGPCHPPGEPPAWTYVWPRGTEPGMEGSASD
jgi:aminoglycoside 6'-N-acetyltransferase